jgi:hypothetical protein
LFTEKRHLAKTYGFSIVLILGVYVYLFCTVLSYQNAWVLNETLRIKSHVLEDGIKFRWSDLSEGLNYMAFEFAPRIYRPFSSYFEILDTKLRASLWNYLRPHPNISLTLAFSLILTPLFFYKFLRKLEFSRAISLCSTTLFLASPGTLSLISMNFRPGKAVTNFCIVILLYYGAVLDRFSQTEKSATRFHSLFSAYCLFLFLSFFWDETALISYVALVFFFPTLLRRSRYTFFLYLSLPFLTALSFLKIIPFLTEKAGFSYPRWASYRPVTSLFEFGMEQAEYFLLNFRLLLTDSLGLVPLSLFPSKGAGYFFVSLAYFAVLFIFVRLTHLAFKKILAFPSALKRLLIFLFLLALFDSVMLSLVTNKYWGLYWYGAYWAIFFSVFLAYLGRLLALSEFRTIALYSLFLPALFYIFPFTNRVYKTLHYYPYRPLVIRDMFTNKINRFFLTEEKVPNLRVLSEGVWQKWKEGMKCVPAQLPSELRYLAVELRLTEPCKDISMTEIVPAPTLTEQLPTEKDILFSTGLTRRSFNGISDAVRLESSESFSVRGPFTVEAWVLPQRFDKYNPIFSAGSYALERKWPEGKMALWINSQMAFSKEDLPLGLWSHVVGVFDGVTIQIYLNGKPSGNPAFSYLPRLPVKDVFIGHNPAGREAGRWWNGEIGKFTLYSRALSPNEVHSLFNAESTQFSKALL